MIQFRLISFFILISIHGLVLCQNLNEIEEIGENPGNLKMYIHVPNSFTDSSENIPLVVALHGCSQNAKRMAEQSGWNELADENKFIVVYPQQKYSNNLSNCFNWFSSSDTEMGEGENASIKQMIDYTLENYPIDSKRVFIYGLSAGAAMAVTVMGNYPCNINSGAIFAGGPYGVAKNAMHSMKVMSNPPDLSPEEWSKKITNQDIKDCVPQIIVVHGSNDNVVSIDNAYELIDQWTGLHQIAVKADEVVNSYVDNPLITRTVFRDSNLKEQVIFYEISETGHALSIDPGNGKTQGGKTGIYAVDNDFFSTYYVALDFGLIRNHQ